jgi:hypothetical protein
LGLAVIVSDEQSNNEKASLVEQAGTIKAINSQTMTTYEGLLALSRELYYTASAQRAASNIDHWLQFLTNTVKNAREIWSNEKRIYHLYQQLHSNYPRHPLVNRLAVQLAQQE